MNLKWTPISVARMVLTRSFRKLVSRKAAGQQRRRIWEKAAQWKDSNTELSLYSWANGELSLTKKALLTPGWPTSWPMAAIMRVRASIGVRREAIGDFDDGDAAAEPYGGIVPRQRSILKMNCSTSTA